MKNITDTGTLTTIEWDPSKIVNTNRLTPSQAKAKFKNGRAFAKAVKDDPSLVVLRRHMQADDYHSRFLGGRNCARLTVPLINVDQISASGYLLLQLGAELIAIAEEAGPVLGKVLGARCVCQTVNRELKGGVDYKGAR